MNHFKVAMIALVSFLVIMAGFIVYYTKTVSAGEYKTGDYFQYVSAERLTAKDDDPDFILASMNKDSMVIIGSSEMNNTLPTTHPYNNFYHQGYDKNFCLLGATGTQSLWAAMEVAAIAPKLQTKKVVFIVSEQWFGPTGIYSNVFQKRYSAKTMQMLLDNKSLSTSAKQEILSRCGALLSGTAYAKQSQSDSLFDMFNSRIECIPYSTRIELTAMSVPAPTEADVTAYRSVSDIDWDAALAQAKLDGAAACTNNDYGINDGYYTQYCASAAQGCNSGTSWSSSTEYDDLALFLQVCNDCGVEPLIVIQPVKGKWADYAGISQDVRNTYYENVRNLAEEYGAQVADFSSYEYDDYFLCDTMHLGWEGWLYVEKAVIDFYGDNS